MSDLRALIRLKEKELRCLEWSLMAQKAQEAAGAFVPESLREELEDRKSEQQVGQTPNGSNREFFFFNFQIIQSQGETSKREQDVGLLWQTRFKSGCPTWEITHLPKQNPSRPRRIFWFYKVFCWAVLSPQHRFVPQHTPLSLSNEKELNSHSVYCCRHRASGIMAAPTFVPQGLKCPSKTASSSIFLFNGLTEQRLYLNAHGL